MAKQSSPTGSLHERAVAMLTILEPRREPDGYELRWVRPGDLDLEKLRALAESILMFPDLIDPSIDWDAHYAAEAIKEDTK